MKSFFFLLFSIFPAFILAQSNYHAGYVVKNNGDTIKGFINYREWAFSPSSIEFKTATADPSPIEFKPDAIKGFQITGLETYISYSGAISMNRTDLSDLPDGLDTSKMNDVIFLRQLVSGKNIALYTQTDTRKTRFFISEHNALPAELKYYPYYTDEKSVEKSDDVYKGQFILLIYKYNNADKKLLLKVETLPFQQGSLAELVAAINGQNRVPKKSREFV